MADQLPPFNPRLHVSSLGGGDPVVSIDEALKSLATEHGLEIVSAGPLFDANGVIQADLGLGLASALGGGDDNEEEWEGWGDLPGPFTFDIQTNTLVGVIDGIPQTLALWQGLPELGAEIVRALNLYQEAVTTMEDSAQAMATLIEETWKFQKMATTVGEIVARHKGDLSAPEVVKANEVLKKKAEELKTLLLNNGARLTPV